VPDDTAHHRWLDPKLLGAVSKLEFKTRKIVEGTRLGRHRSPFHGISVEFAEHRPYVPGDDVRHVDWKIYAKRDRFFIKQYEEETNLAATLLLDVSSSMGYRSDAGGLSKLDYAKFMAAALAFLLIEQQDAVGLVAFDGGVVKSFPPKASTPHFRALCAALEEVRGGERTDLGAVLDRAAGEIDRRGLVVVLSDLVDEPGRVLAGLQRVAHRRHELVVLHVMDGDEIDFPFRGAVRFEDLEGDERFTCDARDLRAAYLAALEEHCARIRTGCRELGIDYMRMDTREPLDVALTGYLNLRARRPR